MDLMNQDIGDLVEEITSSDRGMRGLEVSEDEDEDVEMETHDDGHLVMYEEEEEDGEEP